jgi:hypothetical protein
MNISTRSLIIFFIIGIFIYVFEQTYARSLDYKSSALDREYKTLSDENVALKFKRDSLLSIEKMDAAARANNLRKAYDSSVISLK